MFNFLSELSLSAMWWWLIAAVILGTIEAFTMGLVTIWFAGGAIVASLISLATDSFLLQLFVFVGVSLLLMYFTRPIAVKKLNRETVKTNIDAIAGMTGTAESDVKQHENGTVKVDNKVWTAVLAEGSPEILKGDLITVLSIEGVKLIVRKES